MFSIVAHLKKLPHIEKKQMLESTFDHSALLKIKFREKGKVFTGKGF